MFASVNDLLHDWLIRNIYDAQWGVFFGTIIPNKLDSSLNLRIKNKGELRIHRRH